MPPVVTSLNPNQGPTTGGNSVTITGTGFTGATTVAFGTVSASFVVNSSTQITATAPAQPAGSVAVTVTTPGSGTSNGVTYTYVTVPVVTGLNPNQGRTTGGNSVTITGTGFTGATTVAFGAVSASFVVNSSTQITATAPAQPAGSVAVTVTTPGSGTSNGVTYTYVTVPVVTGLNPNQGPTTGGNSVTITGTGFTGATTVAFGAVSASFVVNSSTQITATAPAQPAGSVAVTVTTPGSGTSNGVTYTYVTVPVVTGLNPNQGPTTGGNSVTITGTGFTGATTVAFGAVSASFVVNSSTQITATAPARSAGSVAVTVTIPGGGTSNGVTYTYVTVPVVTGLNPNQGRTTGGNSVTITGTGFTGATTVAFGVASASFVVNSSTQITATAPAACAETVNITVTTPAGTSNAVAYLYVAAPVVTGVDPGMGPTAGGNTVTINGVNLSMASAVTFGPNAATNITVVSNSRLTVTAPGGTGTVVVTVTTPGGSSAPDQGDPFYIYVPVPVITSLVPNHGPAAGGTDVEINGSSGLTYTDQVLFGATPASFAALSDTILLATSPPNALGIVTVTVHSPGGTSNGLSYQYQP
ncbi:IPT/TIG domain-containing protein [Streptomyces sp. NBC_01728]|uniref:beta strand repeat-containing protein n=1 Tax=unclassified Streptomyces TaxID=2593676 RepID=UPI00225248E8|nr:MULTISPECIES: IPT/TIG domain-containing protein [unclassified Streptomyces]MCX4452335.1 IPT/TIG domain-containing protein [Streptomyces sp. NBC_01719]MCX4491695.1 IPT/TIG domain-containing protein [Streptomyces sp. NBC_01728]